MPGCGRSSAPSAGNDRACPCPALAASAPALRFSGGFLDVPLQVPAGGTTPDGVAYTYSANDASVGDVDGDGVYEIILKWDPSNAKDNSQSGCTGNVYIDAYKLNGTQQHSRIQMLVDGLVPALENVDSRADAKTQLAQAVEANVRWTIARILETPEGRARMAEGRMKAVGAIYELETGRVRVLR